jgi:uncharacterized membrane protein YgcG
LAALATFLCAAAERLWRRCWLDAQNGFGPRAAKAFSLDSDDPAVHFPNLKVSAAKPACLCGLTPATSAPGLTPPLPHLHQDWAHRCHICTGTEAACTRGPAAAAAIALVARCASKGARVLTVLYGLEPHRQVDSEWVPDESERLRRERFESAARVCAAYRAPWVAMRCAALHCGARGSSALAAAADSDLGCMGGLGSARGWRRTNGRGRSPRSTRRSRRTGTERVGGGAAGGRGCVREGGGGGGGGGRRRRETPAHG